MKKAYLFGTALVCLLTTGLWAQQASQSVPLDRTGVERTHVPHENPNMWGAKSPTTSEKPGGGGGGGGGSTPSNPRATFSGSAYSVGTTVAVTDTPPEAEEHIAAYPVDPSSLVTAISDFSLRGGWNTTKYALSATNGASWNQAFVPVNSGNFPVTSDGQAWEANSDPVVAIDRSGNVYLANLYFNGSNSANGFYVSVDNLSGGVSFRQAATRPVAANLNSNTNVSEDKEWIAVDNSTSSAHSGTVYACWTRFVGNLDSIVFSRSADQGQSWSSPALRITPTSQDGAVQGCQVAVGADGEVYVTYEVYYVGGKRKHYMAKSTNGGQSFIDPANPANPDHAGPITPLFNELSFNSTYRKNSFSALAVGPTGNVYVVFADQPNKTSGAEIEFIVSTNGGASFSSPVAINDNYAGQQFFPAVTTDAGGKVHVSWFDTRNAGSSTSKYHVYATSSADGGATFTPNARVTGTLINAGSASFIGDYAGIAAGGGYAHPVWTSGGFNGGVLQTATLH